MPIPLDRLARSSTVALWTTRKQLAREIWFQLEIFSTEDSAEESTWGRMMRHRKDTRPGNDSWRAPLGPVFLVRLPPPLSLSGEIGKSSLICCVSAMDSD